MKNPLIPGFCALLLLSTASCAQPLELVQETNGHHRIYQLKEATSLDQPLTFSDSFTAVTLETADTVNPFKGITVQPNGKLIRVKPAAHDNQSLSGTRSQMIMMPARTNQLRLEAPEDAVPLKLHLLDAKSQGQRTPAPRAKQGNAFCEKPATIDQQDWREGLPTPSYEPVQQEVRHLIVHHSAANSGNTNTRQLIRNIYLNHTNVNGWSDIGYNFVIGVNGTVYQGRDGLGEVPDYQVKGAHFCGKNSGTMGVALIGNYEEAQPPQAALQALRHLLTWKSAAADLDPAAYYKHPSYADSPDFLGVIAGHQDGCATLCPGSNLYSELPAIKQTIQDSLAQCSDLVTADQSQRSRQALGMHVQAKPHQVHVQFDRAVEGKIYFYGIQGQSLRKPLAVNQDQQNFTLPAASLSGQRLFIIRFQGEAGHQAVQKLKLP